MQHVKSPKINLLRSTAQYERILIFLLSGVPRKMILGSHLKTKFSLVEYLNWNLTKQYTSYWLFMFHVYHDFVIIKNENEGEKPSRVCKRNLESSRIYNINKKVGTLNLLLFIRYITYKKLDGGGIRGLYNWQYTSFWLCVLRIPLLWYQGYLKGTWNLLIFIWYMKNWELWISWYF